MRKYINPQKKAGFTLIELLVVISIIGLLASMAVYAFNVARVKARDVKRRADLTQISKALELAFDKDSSYTQPESMCTDTSYGGFGGCGAAGGTGDWDANSDLRDLITDGFMKVLPKDPINNTIYNYRYEPDNNGGQSYTLCSMLETGENHCLTKSN